MKNIEQRPSAVTATDGITLRGAQSRVQSVEPDRDGPRDECGVFGVYAPAHDVARLAYFALFALQHRGQESAGIATCERRPHDDSARPWPRLTGLRRALACARSPARWRSATCATRRPASTGWENAQPVYRHDRRPVALAHNGNLINAVELYNELIEQGVRFRSTSDSEIIAALISSHPAERIEDAVAAVMERLRGAYSTVVMTEDGVVAFRDPAGVRPLCLGRLEDRFVVASESCALDIIGAELMREVQPGELISLGPRGIETRQAVELRSARRTACSSTSTSPGPTRSSRAARSSPCAAGWARSSRARLPSTPTS